MQVVRPDGLNLGQGPGFDAAHVQVVGAGDIVFVLAGPERADGLWWWNVVTRDNIEGWGINDHLAPYSGACFASAVAQETGVPTVLPSSVVGGVAAGPGESAAELPATGTSNGGLIAAGALATVLLVVAGLVRRRARDSA